MIELNKIYNEDCLKGMKQNIGFELNEEYFDKLSEMMENEKLMIILF